jgi:hypothetical protein
VFVDHTEPIAFVTLLFQSIVIVWGYEALHVHYRRVLVNRALIATFQPCLKVRNVKRMRISREGQGSVTLDLVVRVRHYSFNLRKPTDAGRTSLACATAPKSHTCYEVYVAEDRRPMEQCSYNGTVSSVDIGLLQQRHSEGRKFEMVMATLTADHAGGELNPGQ